VLDRKRVHSSSPPEFVSDLLSARRSERGRLYSKKMRLSASLPKARLCPGRLTIVISLMRE